MSREIKFRAWNKSAGQMLNWGVFSQEIKDAIPDDMGDEWTESCEVMQFTGLKDKSGREIYEGDICDGEKETTLEIVWSGHHSWGCRVVRGGVLSVGLIFPLWHWDRCAQNDNRTLEIIGNIHENPELMKSPSGAEGK